MQSLLFVLQVPEQQSLSTTQPKLLGRQHLPPLHWADESQHPSTSVHALPFAMHLHVFTLLVPSKQLPEQQSVLAAQTMPSVLQHALAELQRPLPQQSLSMVHGPAGG